MKKLERLSNDRTRDSGRYDFAVAKHSYKVVKPDRHLPPVAMTYKEPFAAFDALYGKHARKRSNVVGTKFQVASVNGEKETHIIKMTRKSVPRPPAPMLSPEGLDKTNRIQNIYDVYA